MPNDIFDSLFDDYTALRSGPLAQDPSGLSALELTYPKVLLLASASFLEVATVEAVSQLFHRPELPELRTFVERRSLNHQFHSLFDWKTPTANGFFAFFGGDCKGRFTARKDTDAEFKAAVDAFLEIGSLRNQLVHNNYAEFTLEKTAPEIRHLHRTASNFPPQIAALVSSSTSVQA
jgi:hypothetical protein